MKYCLQVVFIFTFCLNFKTTQSRNYIDIKSRTGIFKGDIQKLAFEVTLTDNPHLNTKMDVLNWHNKCKGAIISSRMVLTTTACAGGNVSHMYMYCGYLSINNAEGFLMSHLKDARIVEKHKRGHESGIALIELGERLDLRNPDISLGELPDFLPINKEVPSQLSCNMMSYITNHAPTIVNLQLFERDECNDIIRVLNEEIDMNDTDYCIVLPGTSSVLRGIVDGSTCTWNGKIIGLVTKIVQNKEKSFRIIPVINIGMHVNWIRSKMLGLRYKRSGGSISILKYNLYIILITQFMQ